MIPQIVIYGDVGGVNPIIALFTTLHTIMAKLPCSPLKYVARGNCCSVLWTKSAIVRTASAFDFHQIRSHPSQLGNLPGPEQGRQVDCLTKHSSLFWNLIRTERGENKDGGAKRSKLASVLFGGMGLAGALALLSQSWNRDHPSSHVTIGNPRRSILSSNLFPQLRAHCLEDSGSDDNRPSKRYNFLAEAVEIAAPSVVFIERHQKVATIFGETMSVSCGSGFVVGDGTYVLTNAHVVGNSKTVHVQLKSGRKLKGEVTDMDQVADLALIKVNLPSNEKLPALEFGSSSDLRPGEWVVALGSPLSLSNTITAGIVSSVHRPSKELGLHHHKPDMEYVQTDAPITIGNSGGPLVNLDGKVIGVNTMTAGPGISFAIPSDFAMKFVENAAKTVRKKPTLWGASRYAIGVSMLSVTPGFLMHIRHRISLPSEVTHGVFLAEVWPDGAASEAGLRKGDVIFRINGKDIYTTSDVVGKVQSGKKLEMEVARGSKWLTIIVQPEPLD